MKSKQEDVYNSVDVHNMYKDFGGCHLTRHALVDALETHFSEELIAIHVNGFAKMLMFRESAMVAFKLVKEEDDSDLTPLMTKMSKQVKEEVSEMPFDKANYNKHIDNEILDEYSSETVKKFLNVISPGLGNSLKGYLICNIISESVKGQYTPLQIALGIFNEAKRNTSNSCIHLVLPVHMKR